MELKSINFSPAAIVRGVEIIRGMKSLEGIAAGQIQSEIPAGEFWKKYDAGALGKPAPPAR